MTLVKEISEINWNEPFEITMSEDVIAQDYISCLQKSFGHSSFREMQWKVISSILHDRRDNCVIMATGYGKSLCYQFPSVYLNTITIVVSPLISLMQDQVLALRFYKLRACFLGSAQENRDTVYEIIDRQYNIVYVTPEYITSESGVFLLNKIREYLTLIAIDEAHCISKWGHDFRAAYRNLNRIRDLCPSVPILAMTATATLRVRDDIVQNLKLNNAQIISTGFDRPNLEFGVKLKSKIWNDIGPHIANVKIGSVIVYCISRRITEEVAAVIEANGQLCGVYHAGLSLTQRKKIHENFIHDRIRVICATIAFGMGINKPDVRLVIHYGVAKDVESYYQEVGRAGRDGLPSKCLMFYEAKDWILHNMISTKCKRAETTEEMEKLMWHMRQYVNNNECRRRFILSYFGENCDKLEARSNCCDNCKRKVSASGNAVNLFHRYEGLCENGLLDITGDAMKILTLVRDIAGMSGLHKVLLNLKGSKSKSLPDQFLKHPLYGSSKEKPIKWLEAVGNHLHINGMLTTVQPKYKTKWYYPICKISQKGIQQLNTGTPLKIVPGDEFIRLLKIKVKSLPKILVAKPPDNQLSIGNGTPTIPAQSIIQKTEAPTLFDIYRPLVNVRTKLANLFDVMPYLVASTKALQQLATHQPTSMEELRKLELDGYSEEKTERFGPVFLKVIRDYHAKTGKSMKNEGESKANQSTITRHLIVSDSCEGPSTSSSNTLPFQLKENPTTERLGSLRAQTNDIINKIKVQSIQCPREDEDEEDAVKVIEPSPPPLIEISDTESESESENCENWGSELRDSELLQAGAEVDERFHQNSYSDSENDELDLIIAALKTDKYSTPQVNTRDEKHTVKVEPNCSRNELPNNDVETMVSNNKPTETNKNSLPQCLNKTEGDSDCDLFDEFWDSDVNDSDLTQISEKAEHEIQETTTNIPVRQEGVQSHLSTLPSIKKEATELDLFLDEVNLDLNRNKSSVEPLKKNTNEETQRTEKKTRVIVKTANAFEYENDSSSGSESETKTLTSPKKRVLPSWMQLSNKRKR